MHQVFSDIWKAYPDNMLANRTWHWWWWIHFFENPDRPEFPRQLMVLWVTRNCKKLRVNDSYDWQPETPMEINGNHASFDSIVASWYYDGTKMHEPFILDHGRTETWWEDHDGRISMESDKGNYSFAGNSGEFQLNMRNETVAVELSSAQWKKALTELLPTGKQFIGNIGYSMLKYRALLSSGKIRIGETETTLKGRCYFQKVRMAITPCWYWAIVQWDNGAYLQYFLPHFGTPMLRRSASHDSLMDWGELIVSKSLRFYDPEAGKEYLMKQVRLTKSYENDLPTFHVNASCEEGELAIRIATYARCCWKLSQPLIGSLWHGIFYNEYPARVTDFQFKGGTRTISNDDLGKSYCNCEHTWGSV
ncbi:MAG TPA: hypothetical protein VK503_07665 [Candidatus Bathyarchaeia archaeon]|nr:hypothetical protein [Candidatus Bathyarchaeia archaeon]